MDQYEGEFYDLQRQALELARHVQEIEGLKQVQDDAMGEENRQYEEKRDEMRDQKADVMDRLYETRAAFEEARLWGEGVDPEHLDHLRHEYDEAHHQAEDFKW